MSTVKGYDPPDFGYFSTPPEFGHFCEPPEFGYLGALKTDLSLAIPGGDSSAQMPEPRVMTGFSETVDLNLENSYEDEASVASQYFSPESQVVGWPPVRSYRNISSKYVKVAVDGAPYLRKIDIEIYSSYPELLAAFEDMLTCLTIRDEKMILGSANGAEYVPTYEDKDGDWMLVGDVPWKMFVESCKRLRLMKGSAAIRFAPKTISSKGSQAS